MAGGESEPKFREAALKFTRQRLERHEHPDAVADALRVVPRSVAFDGLEALGALRMPALVVGSWDDSDPGHPPNSDVLMVQNELAAVEERPKDVG